VGARGLSFFNLDGGCSRIGTEKSKRVRNNKIQSAIA
jgi:hypothetical protein